MWLLLLPQRSFGCKSAEKGDRQTRQHSGVITQNACYINKLRSCFQFEPNYTVLTGHREKHRSQGRLGITPACPARGLSIEAKCCHSAVISQMGKVGGADRGRCLCLCVRVCSCSAAAHDNEQETTFDKILC